MKPKQTAKTTTLADKLAAGAPVTLSTLELWELQTAISRLQNNNQGLTRMVTGLAEALDRHNLQVTPTENQDGSIGYDLQLMPDTKPITVN